MAAIEIFMIVAVQLAFAEGVIYDLLLIYYEVPGGGCNCNFFFLLLELLFILLQAATLLVLALACVNSWSTLIPLLGPP